MTTKVVITHDGSLPTDKKLLVTRSYIKKGKRAALVDVAVEMKPGQEITTYVWPEAVIEIRESK